MAVKDVKTPNSGAKSKNAKTPAPVGSDAWRDERPSPFSIEGIRSGAVQSKLFKGLIVASGVVMAFGFIMTSLNPTGVSGGNGAPVNVSETVAQVGDQTITRGELNRAFEYQRQMGEMYGQKTTTASYLGAKSQSLQGLTDNAALIVAAQNAGVKVSSDEIDKEIARQIGEELKPQGGETEAAFRRRIESQYGSIDARRAELENGVTAEGRANVEKSLLLKNLEKSVKDANKVTEEDYKRSVTKLKLWQILVRPEMPKGDSKDFAAEQKKNSEKAAAEAKKLFAALKAKPTLANFKETAKKQSDDTATKAKGGDYGWKLPKEIYPTDWSETLAKSASPLVGPLSDPSGNQTIFFIETRKTEFPKDYAKNKKKLFADFETEQDNAAWQKRQTELQKTVTPEIEDPAITAYRALSSNDFFSKPTPEQKQIRETALSQLQGAVGDTQGMEAAAINYQIAQLNASLGKKTEQVKALQAAAKEAPTDANLLVETARALRESGQTKPALEQLKTASKALDDAPPAAPSMFGGGDTSSGTRLQIASEYEMLKEKKLADAERKKIKPVAAPGGMGGLPPGIQIKPGG